MAFKKKTWIDRMVEFAGRRKITKVSTSAAQIIDVERAEGAVSQEGDAFSAENMNDLEKRISDAFADVPSGYKIADNDTTNNSEFLATARVAYEHGQEIDALSRDFGGLSFGQDANGNWGYKIGGADPVIPFKPDLQSVDVSYKDIIKAGSSKNYNVKEHPHLIIIQASTGTSAGTEESNNWLAYSDGTYGMEFLLTRGNGAPIDIHVVDGLITITAVNLNVSLHDLYYM